MGLLNRKRATMLMHQCGIDAIVATSPRNVLYICDYYCWLDPLFKAYMMRPGATSALSHNFAVLPASGDAALVLPATWAANAPELQDQDLWLYGVGDLDLSAVPPRLDDRESDLLGRVMAGRHRVDGVEALRDVLQDRGLSEARIGIELDGLATTERQRIAEALPRADVRDCSNLLRLIRMVKSEEEVRRLERATQIGYSAATSSLCTAQSGTSVRDLGERFVREVVGAGAELDHFIASPAGLGLQHAPDYRLKRGDVLYVDYGCVYRHYYSDNGTTLVVGDFDPSLDRLYNVLRDGLVAGVDQLRPNVLASEVRRAMFDVLLAGGVTGSNAHGHGVGLEVRDYPIIVPPTGLRIRDECVDVSSDLALEEGMVVNLELPLYLFGVASLHMEQTLLITATGARRLDSSDATEPVRVERGAVAA
jgi:Xaa-Pro aminopeptidase